jgi:phospholipid/cholesterol/gamma-HCH transport system permease protein
LNPAATQRGVLLLVITTFGWGMNWPAMKVLLAELPPLTTRAIGGGLGFLVLLAVVLLQKQSLVVPRAMAMFISMPFLVVECVGCGILASYYVGVNVLNISGVYFLANTQKFADSSDIVMALVKGFFFAGVIVFISCREGLNARDGAVGVGRATTSTVVNCSLAILIVNFFLTMALNVIFPAGQ